MSPDDTNIPVLGARFEEALQYAAHLHARQRRNRRPEGFARGLLC